MKKITVFFAMIIGMMIFVSSAPAQKLDFIIENGLGNISQDDEFNYRNFALDLCPVRLGYGANLLGLYGETNEVYSKDEGHNYSSRFIQWHAGLSFNTKFGYAENIFLKIRAAYGQATTRGFSPNYQDKQRDQLFIASLSFSNWQEDNAWFSRHAIQVLYRQPFASTKIAYWDGKEIPSDSLEIWDNQLIRASYTETPISFFLDRDQDWKMNFDLSIGYGLEHRLIDNQAQKTGYWALGAGFSFFKVPYFQQNIFQLGGELQLMGQTRFVISAKINLVPFLFWIWDKEELEVKLN